jgi:hypothetical protein
MSEEPTSGGEHWSTVDLLQAGWRQEELEWEQVTACVVERVAQGNLVAARQAAGRSLWLAREHLEQNDPRLGTSLVDHGVLIRAQGDVSAGASLIAEGARIWAASGQWIARMTAPRTARSSLFHMRLELRNRPAYEERWRLKWQDLAEDARARVEGFTGGGLLDREAGRTRLERWRRERPAMLNDTRKLMAAALLLLV